MNIIELNSIDEHIDNATEFNSKTSGKFIITNYYKNDGAYIKFLETGAELKAKLQHLRKGNIKDYQYPSVYGVGVVGNKYPVYLKGKHINEYKIWIGVLERCYSKRLKIERPTYSGVTCCDNFKQYTYFYEWANKQVGFNSVDDKGRLFDLDKDLLLRGNKVYSEDTCVFIPQEVNKVLTKSNKTRGENLIGVTFEKSSGRFISQISINSRNVKIGRFKTEIEAFNVYKVAKENVLRGLAEKWKSQIDPRAYKALMNYQVEITD